METGEGREISQLKVIDKQRRKQRGGNIPAREMKQMGHKEVGMVQLYSVMDKLP